MKKSLLLAISLAALIAGSLPSFANSPSLPSITATPTPTLPPSETMNLVTRPGIYAAADFDGVDPQTYHLAGGLRTWNWAEIETAQGEYRWDKVDNWLALQANLGKKAAIAISTYNGHCCSLAEGGGLGAIPRWLRGGSDVAITINECDKQGNPTVWQIPNFYSHAYQDNYWRFIQALGARYRNNPTLEWVATGVGLFGETRAADPDESGTECWKHKDTSGLRSYGYNTQNWVAFANGIADAYMDAFSENGHLQKVLFQQAAPFTFNAVERKLISDYAAQHGLGLSYNSIYYDETNAFFPDDSSCPGCGFFDAPLRYTGVVPTTYETYFYELCDSTLNYWGMINALDKHPTYMRINLDLLFYYPAAYTYVDPPDYEENNRTFAWMAPYLGTNVETAPSAWVAMREHRYPLIYCPVQGHPGGFYVSGNYPKMGNHTFYLAQDDTIAGGKTVPETSDSDVYSMADNLHPYQSYLPHTKESWTTRRTDGAQNPFMWFKLDDRFFPGDQRQYAGQTITVTVTYLDRGNDAWLLRYDASNGSEKASERVQKHNSNTWVIAQFVLHDAALQNRLTGGADFRLDSLSDGDEWVHMVDVKKGAPLNVPTPTSTLTPSATVSVTATDTATATNAPTATSTHTLTPSATATETPRPTLTATLTETPTPTATETQTPAPTMTASATKVPSSPTATSTPRLLPRVRLPYVGLPNL